jgi:ubiquitin carboxyl-terminal hydrolase 4/11/15
VNKTINEFFLSNYDGKSIPRMVIGEGDEKIVEVNLLRLSTILIYPGIVSSFSSGYTSKITEEQMQVSRYIKLTDYYALMEKTVLTFRGNFAKDNSVRLWKYRSADPLKSLY